MSDQDFPALGFDPARGNVATVRGLSQQMKDTGKYAKEAYEVLKSVQDKKDVWTGQAAEAFAGNLDQLPEYLDKGQQSLTKAGRALDEWGDKLQTHQTKARSLEQQATEAIKAAERADAANKPVMYDPNDPAAAQQANTEAQRKADAAAQAHKAADAAWDKVSQLRKQAETVRDWWEDDARTFSKQLKDAAEDAPKESFWDSLGKIGEDFGKWFKDHVGEIGDIAGIVSAVAGAIALFPPAAPIAGPIAIGAGGIALAAHGTDMVMNEKYDDPNAWIGLGGDVAGMVPGVGAVSKGVSATTKGVDAGADVASGADKTIDMAKGVQTYKDEVSSASKPFQWVGEKAMGLSDPGMTDNVAKAFEASTNVGLQVPAGAALFDTTEDTKNTKDGAGAASGGVNTGVAGEQIISKIRG